MRLYTFEKSDRKSVGAMKIFLLIKLISAITRLQGGNNKVMGYWLAACNIKRIMLSILS